jgi:predicted GNAT superfamily acetyltransferase
VAGSQKVIEIRQLHKLDEFADVLRLQQIIWGFADAELLPVRFLVVVGKVGGHVFGAYDGAEMVGFCFAIPGVKPGDPAVGSRQMPYLHSHMLGVLPAYHNAGIGRRLKLQQREEALSRGIQLIEWTFDPLELKNAFLNIEKLGAIVRRYYPNQYGTTSSPLHGGLPTDRCIAEWWIDSPRVRSILAGGTGARNPQDARNPQEHISYPADIARIRSQDSARARQIQQANADRFLHAFEDGLAVTGFARDESEGTYLLGRWQKEMGQ